VVPWAPAFRKHMHIYIISRGPFPVISWKTLRQRKTAKLSINVPDTWGTNRSAGVRKMGKRAKTEGGGFYIWARWFMLHGNSRSPPLCNCVPADKGASIELTWGDSAWSKDGCSTLDPLQSARACQVAGQAVSLTAEDCYSPQGLQTGNQTLLVTKIIAQIGNMFMLPE